jgi:uncharacterized protein (DUF1800 family)
MHASIGKPEVALSASAAQKALIAFQRFGLGAKPGGPDRIGADPKGALGAEVQRTGIAKISDSTLPSYAKACEVSTYDGPTINEMLIQEIDARVDKQMSPEIGFVERLVLFWSNHFAMNNEKGSAVRGTLAQWERDVVRRHVLGRFSDMLLGTYAHPAMIAYLDNEESTGLHSARGLKKGIGNNHNLARELLELHTLGSAGGYTETDVDVLANILTGWSYVRGAESDNGTNGGTPTNRGQFIFRLDWHEPGSFNLMGKTYAAGGMEQLQKVLLDLAAHPSTAEHIAFKLVRHFITDQPTPELVDPIKQKYLKTNGDLKAVSLALLDLPGVWTAPLVKLRTPYEHIIAQYRALGRRYADGSTAQLVGPLAAVSNRLWEPDSPEGYSDETYTWLNPDAMRVRIDITRYVTNQILPRTTLNVPALASSIFSSALSPETRNALNSTSNSNNALVVHFNSPEFQRR